LKCIGMKDPKGQRFGRPLGENDKGAQSLGKVLEE
jgi:hypothetical protein